jgi:hypothetical protein
MNNDHFFDDTGDIITEGWTEEQKIVLTSDKGQDKDIVESVLLDSNGKREQLTRYGSNKADDED